MSNFEKAINGYDNKSLTENLGGAYRSTLNSLLDMNFVVSKLRMYSEENIRNMFEKVYSDNPLMAVKWLFYVRDIEQGLGERRTFRVCFNWLSKNHPNVAEAVVGLIKEYGRYDDIFSAMGTPVEDKAMELLYEQMKQDTFNMKNGKPISLLAKWMPSVNTSSASTRALARKLALRFHLSERNYRKSLSEMRKYLDIVEVKMSANDWENINYDKVPAKANIIYDSAFSTHDRERRVEYLYNVLTGDSKLNANGVMPYEIITKVKDSKKEPLMYELMWKRLIENGCDLGQNLNNTLVVCDVSGSMYRPATGHNTTAIDVAISLAIFFSEQLKGAFKDLVLTFSETPYIVNLSKCESLKAKYKRLANAQWAMSTNIEKVFDSLLYIAKNNNAPDSDIPEQILILSDMQFNAATQGRFGDVVFERIEKKYNEAGIKMPSLIFWNLCGDAGTVPLLKNENGLALISGFATNTIKVAKSESIDPLDKLLDVLNSERYQPVEDAFNSADVYECYLAARMKEK